MAESTAVISFIGDPSGLKPLADALKALGQLTEEQIDAFNKANQEFAAKTKASAATSGKAIDDLSKKFEALTKNIGGGNLNEFVKGVKQGMVEELKKWAPEIKKAGEETKTMTAQLRELKAQLAKLPEGSKEFEKVAIQAAKLQDKIGDVNEKVRVMASDTFVFDAAVDGIRGLTAAFTLAQSASALFGKENEDVQRVLLKVQAATALLISVQEIANLVKGQGAAKTAILTFWEKAYAVAVGTSTGALKAFRTALLATGIGALIVGIGLLVANWNRLTDAIWGASAAEKEAAAARKKAARERKEDLEFEIQLAEKQGKATFDLQLKRVQMQKEEAIQLFQLKKLTQLLREEELILDKQREAAEQENFDSQKKTLELRLALAQKGSREELQARIEIINLIKEHTLNTEKLTAEQRKLINLEADQEILKARREAEAANLEATMKFEPVVETDKEAFDKAVKEAADMLNDRITDIELKPAGTIDISQIEVSEESTAKLQSTIGQKLSAAFANPDVQSAGIEAIQSTFDAISEITAATRAAELESDLAFLDKRREAELSNKNLTESQKEAINAKFARQEASLRAKAFEAEKKAKIASIIANAALASVTLLSTTPPTVGVAPNPAYIASQALIAFQTALGIAIVAKQKFPGFAKGTKNAPGGLALVGEQGPELVHLNQGSKVIPALQTRQVLAGINADKILAEYNIANPSGMGISMDYNKLGKVIGENVSFKMNLGDNGVTIEKRNFRRTWTNRFFEFDL